MRARGAACGMKRRHNLIVGAAAFALFAVLLLASRALRSEAPSRRQGVPPSLAWALEGGERYYSTVRCTGGAQLRGSVRNGRNVYDQNDEVRWGSCWGDWGAASIIRVGRKRILSKATAAYNKMHTFSSPHSN